MAKTKTSKTSSKTTSKTNTSKTASKKSRKSKKVVKEEPVVVVETVPEPVVAATEPVVASTESKVEEAKVEEVDPDKEWTTAFTSLIESQKTMGQSHREQMRLLKSLQSMVLKRVKVLKKRKTKRGGGNQKKNPSGFNKPTHISEELSTFLEVAADTLMPRTEATKMIHKYIKGNKLQNAKDGRQINCDTGLQSLLKVPDDVTLSYFNLQTYLSPHFLKQ